MLNSEYITEISRIIIPATKDTLYMVFFTSLIATIIGIIIGVTMYITNENNIMENKIVYKVLNTIVNIGRSIPFVIIIIAVFPLSRLIVGTGIGSTACIVPLTVATIPFTARVIEGALAELDKGIIEASISFGASNKDIIFKVMLPEASSSIVNGVTLTIISVIGYSAMAGIVGGGGLGDVAIRYGYQRNRTDLLYITIIILVVFVQIVQKVGNYFVRKLNKK